MDRDRDTNNESEEADGQTHDIGFEHRWPARPGSRQSGSAEESGFISESRPGSAGRAGGRTESRGSSVPSWTAGINDGGAQRSSEVDGSDDPNATRVLPVVERSRVNSGGQARSEQPYPAPQAFPARLPQQSNGAYSAGPGARARSSSAQQSLARRPAGSDDAEWDPKSIQGAVSPPSGGYARSNGYTGASTHGAPGSSYRGYSSYDEETKKYTAVQRPPTAHLGNGGGPVYGAPAGTSKVKMRIEEAWAGGPEARPGYISAAQGTRRRRVGLWLLWALLGVLVLGIVSATAFTLAWQGQYSGKMYPGVKVLDTDLGGKTPDEARKLLSDRVQSFLRQPVVFTWRAKEWRPSADEIGLKVDVDAAVNKAFSVGRGGDAVTSVSQQWAAAQGGYQVPLVLQFSEPALQTYLKNIARDEIDQELVEGDVRLDGANVKATPGQEGRSLRVYDAIAAVRAAITKPGAVTSSEPQKVELPVDSTQPIVSADEVQDIQNLLQVRVSGPITATVPGGAPQGTNQPKTYTLDREALIRFTTIERNPDRTAAKHVQLGWKEMELKVLADKWVADSKRAPENARFAWSDGSLSVTKESVPGFESDSDSVMNTIKAHADVSDSRTFDLPGKIITPTVSSSDIGKLGIKDLLGTGTSTFVGSSKERATNIAVAARLINGAVIPPGATFSFLDTVGGIDEDHGFVEGYVIAAERTQKGVGGGVCQVSTTTFRAAFWAGLQITERNQHSYRVSWYEANGEPVGFDAAVFDPGVDLKFVNNTPSYVLLQTEVGSDYLKVSLYGTKTPGTVKLEGPAISNQKPPPPDVYEVDPRLPAGTRNQVETAHGGLDTVITRRIIVPGQPDRVDKFYSSYKPWPNWYIVASPSQIPGNADKSTPVVTPVVKATEVPAAPEAAQPTQAPANPTEAPAPVPTTGQDQSQDQPTPTTAP